MAPPLVVVACMFSLMWAWLEKVALMDVGIKLQKNHSIFSLYMWKNAIPSIVFFVKHRLLNIAPFSQKMTFYFVLGYLLEASRTLSAYWWSIYYGTWQVKPKRVKTSLGIDGQLVPRQNASVIWELFFLYLFIRLRQVCIITRFSREVLKSCFM